MFRNGRGCGDGNTRSKVPSAIISREADLSGVGPLNLRPVSLLWRRQGGQARGTRS